MEKNRYRIPAKESGLVWEVDEFFCANAPLVTAEIELPDEKTVVEQPGGQQYSQVGYVKPDADGFVTIKAGPLTVVVYKTQVWYQKMPGEAVVRP